ncbi:MAG: hypothetical protein K0R93_702 [Anaerosolibacter sp.]|jgi:glutamate mutase epsilon subunit|uniref:hypothetical protein n=1 Tax=Anaerosolibacter sp. TaxID=1872527 RepID=UPI0026103945|nr:hypothetical protein [Anaerosolibacter sp.]MDF2545804.1 hypothetical protein [Anaerosolibacter sp.]
MMDKHIVGMLQVALAKCKTNVQEVVMESDDPSLVIGLELGSVMVIEEIENIIKTYME